MLGWEAAFPTLEPKRMGLHLVAADTLPGVHLPALDAGDLLAFSGWNQSAQSFGASEDDWQAARRWTEHLRTVLAGKVFLSVPKKNVRFAVKQRTGRCKSFMEAVSSEAHSLILFSKCLFASRTHGREYHDEKEKG